MTIVRGMIYHRSFVLNSLRWLALLVPLYPTQVLFKQLGLCGTLVHFSGFRVSTLRAGLSSKDNAEFIIIWGNFKFTTKVANEIPDSQKVQGLS